MLFRSPCLDIEADAAVPPPARPVPREGGAALSPATRPAVSPIDRERAAVLDRLLAENRLPPDVAARLRKS